MNTRDSVKWEVIFCHFEITVDNWHFNVAPFTKQWTHLKPHEAFCQVIYHINPHFLKLNPHSHRVNPGWIPVFRSVTFTGWRIPLFYFDMSIFGSFQEFQGPALPILPQLYVVCLKIGYIPNYSHLIGIMIMNHWVQGYTIFRHTHMWFISPCLLVMSTCHSEHGARWETSSVTGAQAQHWGDWALSLIPLVPRLATGGWYCWPKVMTWADK